ncbi:MAG: hypothetical protein ACYDDF_09495 [Thermoplasmatota archaeon]
MAPLWPARPGARRIGAIALVFLFLVPGFAALASAANTSNKSSNATNSSNASAPASLGVDPAIKNEGQLIANIVIAMIVLGAGIAWWVARKYKPA